MGFRKMGIKLVVVGAAGRMGSRILSLAVESGRFDIVGAVERQDCPSLGKDAGLSAASGPIGILLDTAFPTGPVEVVIDFSLPEGIDKSLNYCLKNSVALVLGTTGLSASQQENLKGACSFQAL